MKKLTHILHMELLGPTRVSVRLASQSTPTYPIAIRPVEFLLDFAAFLTALRAEGMTQPIDAKLLHESWKECRKKLRKQLLKDPWGEKMPTNYKELYGLDPEEAEEPSHAG